MEKNEAIAAIIQHSNVLRGQVAAIEGQIEDLNKLLKDLGQFSSQDVTLSHLTLTKNVKASFGENRAKIVAGFAECQKSLTELHKVIVHRVKARVNELA